MAGVVVFWGIFFDLAVWEWIIILILFGMVMGAELINTSIEELANVVKEKNKLDYTKNEDQRMTILDVEYAVRTMELLDRWFPGCHELVEDFG